MPNEPAVANARAFVRSFHVLLKFSRLYGLDHVRSAGKLDISWNDLQEALKAAGDSGLLLGTSGTQLLLEGVPLGATPAERSFAEMLNSAGLASIYFRPNVQRAEFAHLVKLFAETGLNTDPLSKPLKEYFGKSRPSGIVVNERRSAAEDAAESETRMAVESHADILDGRFWAAVPESRRRAVLTSREAWRVPPRNVQQYVEELIGRGESDAAADILLQYAACVRNEVAEACKKTAIGLGQLAELYSKTASHKLQDVLLQIGQQLDAEKGPELQTLLSAAFVRLSQEAAQQRDYRAMQQALDCLADLEGLQPTWVQSLRSRIGVENRLSDFIEEALTAETAPEGLIGVLTRVPESASEHLAARLASAGRRSERERVMSLARAVGNACPRHLIEVLKSGDPAKAAGVVGLLSRLDPAAVRELLPQRLRRGARGFHDSAVRQLAIAGAEGRGRLLADVIELLDPWVLPLALDEIGMCGDPQSAPKLLLLAQGEILPDGTDFMRVKAIEALGRMRAAAAVGHLRYFVETRKGFGWAYAEEIRTAAAQALEKLDPDWLRENLPKLGLNEKVLSLAPLDPARERDVVRHRRYQRIRLPRNVPVVVTSQQGKYSSSISVLSLDGGLLSGDMQLAVGAEATLKIPAGPRSINMRAVVRFVRSRQAGFEMVGMRLEDRAKLRRLLVSLGGDAAPGAPAPA